MKFTREQVIEMAAETELAEARDDASTLPAEYVNALSRLCTIAADRALEVAANSALDNGVDGIPIHGDDVVAEWLRAMKEAA